MAQLQNFLFHILIWETEWWSPLTILELLSAAGYMPNSWSERFLCRTTGYALSRQRICTSTCHCRNWLVQWPWGAHWSKCSHISSCSSTWQDSGTITFKSWMLLWTSFQRIYPWCRACMNYFGCVSLWINSWLCNATADEAWNGWRSNFTGLAYVDHMHQVEPKWRSPCSCGLWCVVKYKGPKLHGATLFTHWDPSSDSASAWYKDKVSDALLQFCLLNLKRTGRKQTQRKLSHMWQRSVDSCGMNFGLGHDTSSTPPIIQFTYM